MSKFFKNKFGLTDSGAKKITRACISSFLVYIGNMLPMLLLMAFLDDILIGNQRNTAVYLVASAIIIVFLFVTLEIDYNRTYNITYEESAALRTEIAEKLAKLPMSFFSTHNLSDLSQTIMSDVAGIEHAISHAIPKLGAFTIFMPVISVLLIASNIKLGIAVALPNILSLVFALLSNNIQEREWNKYYKKLRSNSESYQETIELAQELKTFNKYDEVKKDLYHKINETEKIHWNVEVKMGIIMFLTRLLGYVSITLVAIFGIQMVMNKEINILYFIGYMLAALSIKNVFDGSEQFLFEAIYLAPKVKTIKKIFNTEIQKGKDSDISKFDIELKNVSFSYNDNSKVIDNISFTAQPGEVTAIVGPSGCGKSTLLKLISRLYDYDDGEIKIGGKDIKNLSTNSLYKNVSVVFQDVQLFNNTVMENIRIGNKNASDDEVKEAAKLANCEFIENLEKGFETMIGENGAELSGGERQRISIARAFLKNAPIVILDEIASNLDVSNEQKIQDSLNKLMKGKTVIIISHRMKSIENTDKIVVMDNGRVDAIGNHSELLAKSPIYKNLIEKSMIAEEFEY